MFNCSTNCLCPIRIATNGSTSLLNENFQSISPLLYAFISFSFPGARFEFRAVLVYLIYVCWNAFYSTRYNTILKCRFNVMQISSPELYKLSCPNFILLLLVVRSHFCILPLFFKKKKERKEEISTIVSLVAPRLHSYDCTFHSFMVKFLVVGCIIRQS